MVIRTLDYVRQCYTQEDGQKIYAIILPYLEKKAKVQISFEGVEFIPSSFVNTALIALLDKVPFQTIKECLSFVNTTKQINEMIRDRFSFEINHRIH
jgi:hypothetical protein